MWYIASSPTLSNKTWLITTWTATVSSCVWSRNENLATRKFRERKKSIENSVIQLGLKPGTFWMLAGCFCYWATGPTAEEQNQGYIHMYICIRGLRRFQLTFSPSQLVDCQGEGQLESTKSSDQCCYNQVWGRKSAGIGWVLWPVQGHSGKSVRLVLERSWVRVHLDPRFFTDSFSLEKPISALISDYIEHFLVLTRFSVGYW